MNKIIASMLALAASAQEGVTSPYFKNNQMQSFGIGSWDMSLLNYYLCPGIMAGYAVFLFIVLIFLCLTCQLMAVQTPTYFIDKSIDFGKSEEVEWYTHTF